MAPTGRTLGPAMADNGFSPGVHPPNLVTFNRQPIEGIEPHPTPRQISGSREPSSRTCRLFAPFAFPAWGRRESYNCSPAARGSTGNRGQPGRSGHESDAAAWSLVRDRFNIRTPAQILPAFEWPLTHSSVSRDTRRVDHPCHRTGPTQCEPQSRRQTRHHHTGILSDRFAENSLDHRWAKGFRDRGRRAPGMR